MGEEEFIREAKKLGYSKAMIDEVLAICEEAKRNGIKLPLEAHLIELPE